MTRHFKRRETVLRAKVAREKAMERVELRQESTPRVAAAGATSYALKAEDPEVRRLIDEALARRR